MRAARAARLSSLVEFSAGPGTMDGEKETSDPLTSALALIVEPQGLHTEPEVLDNLRLALSDLLWVCVAPGPVRRHRRHVKQLDAATKADVAF